MDMLYLGFQGIAGGVLCDCNCVHYEELESVRLKDQGRFFYA